MQPQTKTQNTPQDLQNFEDKLFYEILKFNEGTGQRKNKLKTKLSQKTLERNLLISQEKRLEKYLYFENISPPDKNIIMFLYKEMVDKDNILDYYQHPIDEFAQALVDLKLSSLRGNTAVKYKTKKEVK